ncbi:MAG: hypothetical protein M3O84_02685 [Actinomycetota bacterium]|nr:hypothetical protein [Actinomycetota bacterium]
MRRWTFVTIIALFVVLSLAAAYQLLIASRNSGPFGGPVQGTPLPTHSASPGSSGPPTP